MKRTIIFGLIAMLFSVSSYGQTKKEVPNFSKININGNITTTVKHGEESYFDVKLENTTENFEWSVKDGELIIKLKSPLSLKRNTPVPAATVTIVYKKLDGITIDGNCSLVSDGVIENNVLSIKSNGKSEAGLEVKTEDLRIDAVNSKVSVKGASEFITIKASGGASVNTVTMDCNTAIVNTQTNAECYVKATKKLDAKATTNSNIFYKGKPEILNESKASLGAIEGF